MKNALSIFVLLTLLACGQSDDDGGTDDDMPVQSGLIENQVIDIAGTDREYHLFVPSNPTNAPVVLLFHGNGGSHDNLIGLTNASSPYKVWLDIAQDENIILAIPNGTLGSGNSRGWNDCRSDAPTNPDIEDVLFVSTLIDSIVDRYNANAAKVFVLGTSNGGHLCIRLAEEIPDKLTAFGAIVASNSVNSQCAGSNVPVSALFIHGTSDPVLPYEGGMISSERGQVFSAEETVHHWVNRNETETMPELISIPDIDLTDGSTIEKRIFRNGRDNTEVVFYKVIDGGHTEPSIEERYSNFFLAIVGNQNADVEMANEVWSFFETKSKQ